MLKVAQIALVMRTLGPRWVIYRIAYAVRLKVGLVRKRMPCMMWPNYPQGATFANPIFADPANYADYRRNHAPKFLFAAQDRSTFSSLLAAWDRADVGPCVESERIGKGEFQLFGHAKVDAGFPPAWLVNPLSGQSLPGERHWSEIDEFEWGDIKPVWELSRFGFAFSAVRAYWRTGHDRYPRLFWDLLESWREANEPNVGPNWKCGQETALRAMAWCFALYGFIDAPSSSPERISSLAQMIAISGERIEGNLSYALSQRNNHGVSEAAGLWTIGVLFPEFKNAERWRNRGREILEELASDLVYDDGAFAQHSLNYHRLMLQDYLWVCAIADTQGTPFSSHLKERLSRASRFLFDLQDRTSGRVPCYGPNDGALVLPLNNCEINDFRPALQAAFFYFTGNRVYAPGPWDEDLVWLFGPASLRAPLTEQISTDLHASTGGYYVLRAKRGFSFVRCGSFRHRPGHADMLHVDIWWRGKNITIDPGTFSYNAPKPWYDAFAGSACHNVISVDSRDQMDRLGRFLWVPWLRGEVREFKRSEEGALTYWEGQHNGYARLDDPVVHRRGVLRIGDDHWLIVDSVSGTTLHDYRLQWLFEDVDHSWNGTNELRLGTGLDEYSVYVKSDCGGAVASLVRADAHSQRGWRSEHYLSKTPALSLALEARARSVHFFSVFGPGLVEVSSIGGKLKIGLLGAEFLAQLQAQTAAPIIKSITVTGKVVDSLQVS